MQVNIWNIICLNCDWEIKDMRDRRSYLRNLGSWDWIITYKKLRLPDHDLCDTGVVVIKQSCQANWKEGKKNITERFEESTEKKVLSST